MIRYLKAFLFVALMPIVALAASEFVLTPISAYQASVTNNIVHLDVDNPTGKKIYSTALFAMPEIAESDATKQDYVISLHVKLLEGKFSASHGFKYKELQQFYFESGRFEPISKTGLYQVGTRRLIYDSYDALDRFVFATESRKLKAEIGISIAKGVLPRKDKNSPAFFLCENRPDRVNIGWYLGPLLAILGVLLLKCRAREDDMLTCHGETLRAPGEIQRLPCLDALKGLSCIAVVLLHYNLPSIYGDWLRQSLKFAVPLFFIISGFFSVSERGVLLRDAILHRVRGLIRLVVVVHICYMAIHSILPEFGAALYKNGIISTLVVFVLGNSSFPVLWFLGALIYCYLTVWIFSPTRISSRSMLLLVLIFFVLTLYIQEISNVLPLTSNGLKVFGITSVPYKNTYLFRGFLFFIIGMLLRLNVSRIRDFAHAWFWVIISLLGCVAAVFESMYMGFAQFFLGNYITAIAMVCFGVVTSRRFVFLERIGRKLSVFVYLVHYPIGMIVMGIVTSYGFERVHPVRYFSCVWVVLLSLSLACLFNAIKINGGGSKT